MPLANISKARATVIVSGLSNKADKEQEHQRPQQGGDDVAAKRLGIHAEPRRQQPGYSRSKNPDNDVADEAEPVALHQQAGEPTRHGADDDPGENRFRCKHQLLLWQISAGAVSLRLHLTPFLDQATLRSSQTATGSNFSQKKPESQLQPKAMRGVAIFIAAS